jgi:hypothetical protein
LNGGRHANLQITSVYPDGIDNAEIDGGSPPHSLVTFASVVLVLLEKHRNFVIARAVKLPPRLP